jgi:Pentapeptide repeats (8 copies)
MSPHARAATMSLGSGSGQRPVGPRLALPVAGRLAHHEAGPAWQPRPLAARDAARSRWLALGAGLLAVGALVVTARSRARSRAGQLAGRYARALGQLGCEELDVRMGGIRALERVARDSPGYHAAVMGMLAAFIRERSRQHWPPPDPGGRAPERSPRPDVQAAITAVGRRRTERDLGPVDLAGADLTDADLTDADLTGAVLAGAVLARADLLATRLVRADLCGADLGGARLTGADLAGADLTGADLADADLAGADLAGADLAGAELTGALWPAGGPVPAGWERHTGSGQLIAAGTGADRAQAHQAVPLSVLPGPRISTAKAGRPATCSAPDGAPARQAVRAGYRA